MFKRIAAPVCIALFALTANFASAASLNANWASLVIINNTIAPINYTVEWNDGQIEQVTIMPGQMLFHGVTLNEFGMIPTPYIHFDNALEAGSYAETVYELDAYVVDDPRIGGKGYSFVTSADGQHLQLFAI